MSKTSVRDWTTTASAVEGDLDRAADSATQVEVEGAIVFDGLLSTES